MPLTRFAPNKSPDLKEPGSEAFGTHGTSVAGPTEPASPHRACLTPFDQETWA